MTRRARRFAPALAALLACAASAPLAAQDFASGLAALAAPGPARLLEHGLPAGAAAPALALGHVRWHGMAELTTRSLAASGGWRALRVAAGVSQTGDPETGWTALALGLGWSERGGGAGARLVARRDRTGAFAFDTRSEAWGLEAGAGGWIAFDASWRAWASAPSLWREGGAPPLARPLAFGAAWERGGVRAWLAHAAAPAWAGAAGAGLSGGAGLRFGPAWLTLAGRDHPARPSLGLELATRAGRVAVEAESHPVLGTTTKLVLAPGRDGAPREPAAP